MRCLDVLSSVAGCFTLPLSKAGQFVQQWVASLSFWAGAGWWGARVIGREISVGLIRTKRPWTADWQQEIREASRGS